MALVEYHRNEDRNLASNYVQMLVNVSFTGHISKRWRLYDLGHLHYRLFPRKYLMANQ